MSIHSLEVKCRKNCRSDDAGITYLSVGENLMELATPIAGEIVQSPFGFLRFVISPRIEFANAKACLEIRWQDVLVKTFSLHLKDAMVLEMPIRFFKTPSSLRVTVSIELDPSYFEGDFQQHSSDFARLEKPEFLIDRDVLQARKHLLPAAQHCARNIGLCGNYMDEERTTSFEEQIHTALIGGIPFSAIRLGDGEGRVLGYPDFFSDLEVLTEVLYYHFGPESMNKLKEAAPGTWIRDAMMDLRGFLVKALQQADVIGLPISEYFDQYETAPSTGLVGFACSLSYGLSLGRHVQDVNIVGANLFQLLAGRGRLYKRAAAVAKAVHVVGPWDISNELSDALGKSINWIKVPGHYTWRGEKGLGHYPELYRYVEKKLISLSNLEGQLFFVGAGILGKYYCTLIKERGGVALDIGSVLDSWVKRGRPDAVNNNTISFEKL